MLIKKEAKDIQSLAHKKYRDDSKLFVAEGPKIVAELIELIPDKIQKLYATEDWTNHNQAIIKRIAVQIITQEELQKISQLQTANQVLALVRQFPVSEPTTVNGLCVYLDAIQDPGNLGTIIRLADWFGIKNVICTPGCADLYNPKVVQSTMASIARVTISYDATMEWLKNQDVPIVAATLNGKPVHEFRPMDKGVLVIGNESKGVRPEILELASEQITIPRKGLAESLNAAVATGILLSHLTN